MSSPSSDDRRERARPRLLLHIGMHKTGTTSIQRALAQGREALRAAGVCYGRTDRAPWPDLPKHTSVFHAAMSQDESVQEAERQALLADFDASGGHTLLISEEGLSEPQACLVDFFLPWQAHFDIEVVCLLRRQDLFVESLYNQFTREPARHESRTPLAFSRAPAIRQRLDYASMLGTWQQRLGARVVALDFDAVGAQGGLMPAFARAGGLPSAWAEALAQERANRSPDLRLCLALRRLNLSATAYALAPLMRAATQLEREGRFQPLRRVLGRDERRRLMRQMQASNERLAQAHQVSFSDAWPEDEPAAAVEDVEPGYLLELLAGLSVSQYKSNEV